MGELVVGSSHCYLPRMDKEWLMTSWGEYAGAIVQVLSLARRSLVIFDHDLVPFGLEMPARYDVLAAFLGRPGASLRVAVQSVLPVQQHSPRLLALLRLYAHNFQLVETPPHLASLDDSMLLADGESGVIRFHRDHARSKAVIGDAVSCLPYCRRFEEIWAEGGRPISTTTLGL